MADYGQMFFKLGEETEGIIYGDAEPVRETKEGYISKAIPGITPSMSLSSSIDSVLQYVNECKKGGECDEKTLLRAYWAVAPQIILSLSKDEKGQELFRDKLRELAEKINTLQNPAGKKKNEIAVTDIPEDVIELFSGTLEVARNKWTPRAKSYTFSTTIIRNTIQSGWDFSEIMSKKVGYIKESNEDAKIKAIFDEPIDNLDLDLMDAIGSLMVMTGRNSFTLSEIWRMVTKAKGSPNPSTLDKWYDRMVRNSKNRVFLDFGDHLRMKKIEDVSGTIDTNLLSFERVPNDRRKSGKTLDEVHFDKIPPLFYYAALVEQVTTLTDEVLSIPEMSTTEDNLIIRNFLARRVMQMKNPNNKIRSDSILLDGIYNLPGLSIHHYTPSQKKKAKFNYREKAIKPILNHWRCIGFISDGSDFVKDKNSKGEEIDRIKSIKIILNEEKADEGSASGGSDIKLETLLKDGGYQ